VSGDGQQTQAQRRAGEAQLRGDQQFAPVELVGGEATDGQQQQHRPELQGHDDAQGGGILFGQLRQHQPVLGGALHPGADVGNDPAKGPDAEVVDGQ
jgi:hypothetical protein